MRTNIALRAIKGDHIQLEFTITRDDEVLDITGATFEFAAKKWLTDNTRIIEHVSGDGSIEIEDADGGIVVVTLAPEDTNDFVDEMILHIDLTMTEASGQITTVCKDRILIELGV